MRKSTLIIFLGVTTLAAVAAAWLWALRPLAPLFYIHPTNWTDADLVRHLWHFRLVQPEWITPSNYLRWAQTETVVRVVVVFLAWLASNVFLIRRYFGSRKDSPPALNPIIL